MGFPGRLITYGPSWVKIISNRGFSMISCMSEGLIRVFLSFLESLETIVEMIPGDTWFDYSRRQTLIGLIGVLMAINATTRKIKPLGSGTTNSDRSDTCSSSKIWNRWEDLIDIDIFPYHFHQYLLNFSYNLKTHIIIIQNPHEKTE